MKPTTDSSPQSRPTVDSNPAAWHTRVMSTYCTMRNKIIKPGPRIKTNDKLNRIDLFRDSKFICMECDQTENFSAKALFTSAWEKSTETAPGENPILNRSIKGKLI